MSLTDYGTGTPSTQRQTRGWVLTQSALSPNEVTGVTNSVLALWNHGGTTLAAGDVVQNYAYLLDKTTCNAMASEKAMSYFGGSSLDYAEDGQRIYRLDWGINAAVDVPDNTCY